MRTVPESDWKVLRGLLKIAFERYCERALLKVSSMLADASQSKGDQFRGVLKSMQASNRDIDHAFFNESRSNAFMQILALRSRSLWTGEEFSQFGAETREAVGSMMASTTSR